MNSLNIFKKRHFWLCTFFIFVLIPLCFFISIRVVYLSFVNLELMNFECENRLSAIYNALRAYAFDDPDMYYPASNAGIEQLVEKGYLHKRNLYCPFDYYKHLSGRLYWRVTPSKCSYRYLPGLALTTNPPEIMVYENSTHSHFLLQTNYRFGVLEVYTDRANALFSDGTIRALPLKTLKALENRKNN